jgi:hypothetical protein
LLWVAIYGYGDGSSRDRSSRHECRPTSFGTAAVGMNADPHSSA